MFSNETHENKANETKSISKNITGFEKFQEIAKKLQEILQKFSKNFRSFCKRDHEKIFK